ncbi:maleylpyruvate isomerase N-terminal domain-containing protein [Rathayibacter oskolensis]|uniref:maleylpyruvate isomerase N-terminal domain-containing protein n=1 Tax=Rathayibacter oskolensis TaxID=1891671 RepID=UPI0034664CC5
MGDRAVQGLDVLVGQQLEDDDAPREGGGGGAADAHPDILGSAPRAEESRRRASMWSMDSAAMFETSATAFLRLLERIGDDQWTDPGLGDWDVRGLAGHTARAILTVETYLRADDQVGGRSTTPPPTTARSRAPSPTPARSPGAESRRACGSATHRARPSPRPSSARRPSSPSSPAAGSSRSAGTASSSTSTSAPACSSWSCTRSTCRGPRGSRTLSRRGRGGVLRSSKARWPHAPAGRRSS